MIFSDPALEERAAHHAIDRWNACYPVGQAVTCWAGPADKHLGRREGVTIAAAALMGVLINGRPALLPAVWVRLRSSAIFLMRLDRVEAVT